MILALLLQAATVSSTAQCQDLIRTDPAAARAAADRWRITGGGLAAQSCAGLAEAARGNWSAAASVFEDAAHAAELAHNTEASNFWAQAGNARLAAGDPAHARRDLDAALASGTLTGDALGEARLDRARAAVAAGDLAPARTDIDAALKDAGDDPLAWLLSATLARRAGDLQRARTDIAQALSRSPDDASVQLEAGNIGAKLGDEEGARAAWREAARLAPNAPAGKAAAAALEQFGGN